MKFIDKMNREIQIEINDYDVEAFHQGARIGHFQFDDLDGHPILYHMDVLESYQRSGIGTAMMKEAVKVHGERLGKPSFNAIGGDTQDRYTDEGSQFIWQCVKDGILADTEPREEPEFEPDWDYE
ncbi:N-acetyltransferase domain-containing protein [Vibrio crassostreae]|uniref:GNAT family N-acetyltransferase n=1 Tax=Vibrio crassostreae TaxID=246167 RepID=UPI001B30FC0C|nr:GNAT family N-acetyltransferase [Vibrio crassostreae]CAK1831482.1 N-acetyltransferase domain-containing protein [Vibrio crassostreae]CAK1833606.1 N-acetyltransferase domain-containing protein [Vibrio crassostreae]CAK1836005.1 N-acetyltransferase domain-containing protein [Vibrio crassostreae]CAK1840437.1 N-acetyltransferase domain-containing protein [Vibrio crassostreae]CAK1844513.1 N-acetyltransferase domain-containing protein [Vibrio crassostreae]